MERTDRQIRNCKGIALSFVLHAFCIAGVLLSVALSAQHPDTVQVLLTLEPSSGGAGKICQETPGVKKSQSLSAKEKPCRRSPIRQTSLPALSPAMDKAPVEKSTDATPVLNKTPVETAAPIKAVGSGIRGEAAVPAIAGAGTGEGNGAGRHEGAGQGRESQEALKNRYLREHFAYIRDLILKNLSYPPMARKGGWQGKVKVSFIVREDGRVEGIRIVESSGYLVLDRNVVETIREVQPFPKPPVRAELVIPVTYALKT
ncbi:outer membrane transport energization protein TonB [Syntrophus gentianae]|uniref:Outer membrane transport energization protein TonB n=1 Tax=Syntrophus gentianae TaxID=43775 RepID=A0A1H8A8U4_9BACT|nr:energy transducer TonB [Syntrophus gentianae]SEM67215.1 outer membrane transport energization protein TonB [Syntrophus gentianae]